MLDLILNYIIAELLINNFDKVNTTIGTLNTNSDYNNLLDDIFLFNTWTGQGSRISIHEADIGIIIQKNR